MDNVKKITITYEQELQDVDGEVVETVEHELKIVSKKASLECIEDLKRFHGIDFHKFVEPFEFVGDE